MSEVEEDYSDYIKFVTNISNLGTVLAGFTLTTLTLLITLLPDPSQVAVQITLFFLALLFDIYMFCAGWGSFNVIYYCRRVPPRTRQLNILNNIGVVAFSMLGGTVVLIFWLSSLNYLALASVILWIVLTLATYIVIWRPFGKFSATRARLLERGRSKQKE
jgi:hypothetical protein